MDLDLSNLGIWLLRLRVNPVLDLVNFISNTCVIRQFGVSSGAVGDDLSRRVAGVVG